MYSIWTQEKEKGISIMLTLLYVRNITTMVHHGNMLPCVVHNTIMLCKYQSTIVYLPSWSCLKCSPLPSINWISITSWTTFSNMEVTNISCWSLLVGCKGNSITRRLVMASLLWRAVNVSGVDWTCSLERQKLEREEEAKEMSSASRWQPKWLSSAVGVGWRRTYLMNGSITFREALKEESIT